MLPYLCLSTLFYSSVFRHLYTPIHDGSTFDECAQRTRIFSMVHLGVCLPLASFAMYMSPCVWCMDVLFERQHYLYEMALMNTTGYFIVDIYVLCRNWFKYKRVDGGTLMFVHHISSFVTYYNAYRSGIGQHALSLFLLNETSTVFLNGIHFYARRPRVRIVCGAGLLVTFFVFRILMFARINYILFRNWHMVTTIPPYMRVNLLVVTTLFTGMNLFWFQKIVKGFMNALTKKKTI